MPDPKAKFRTLCQKIGECAVPHLASQLNKRLKVRRREGHSLGPAEESARAV